MDGCTNSQIDPMKIIIILITALFVSSAAFSADSLKTTITKATVFLSGAQVFRAYLQDRSGDRSGGSVWRVGEDGEGRKTRLEGKR